MVINRTFKLLPPRIIRCISLKCKVQEYEVSNLYQKLKYWIMKKIIERFTEVNLEEFYAWNNKFD